jgi:peptidoglycan/LPS O-acetylase OafA/YrhL
MNSEQLKVMKPEQLSHPKYRPDIDGLRALAVLAVVAFHAFPAWFKGGFVGVDIFFVISGYLISSIIFENLSRGTFSFIEFYVRRVKRIFPALLIVLFACLVFGWWALLAEEYQQLGKHVAAGAGFVSNFALWGESGYFDSAAELKPLLHLWSLGIEEQFYIVWPLFICFAWRFRDHLLAITLLILLCSFGLNLFQISTDPIATFYSPNTRYWELLVGASLAHLTLFKKARLQAFQSGSHHAMSFLGLSLIFLAFALVTKDSVFPGWWAVLPTIGAALLICAGPQAWFNRVFLSNKLFVWIGLISFPLYLWHWPLLSFAHIVEGDMPSRWIRIVAIALAILLAYLTYRFVEKPMRSNQRSAKKAGVLIALMLLVGLTGYICYQQGGFDGKGYRTKERSAFANYFENSLPQWKYYESIGRYEKYRQDCDFYDVDAYRAGHATKLPRPNISASCYQKDPSKSKTLLLWGDSHAQQLYYGLNKNLPSDWQVLIVASSACMPNASVKNDSSTDYCAKSNRFAQSTIKQVKPDIVLIAQTKGHGFREMQALQLASEQLGAKKALFLGPVLHWKGTLPNIVMRKLWTNTPERTLIGVDNDFISINAQIKKQFQQSGQTNYLDAIGVFCNSLGCLTRIGNDRRADIVTYDYGHLTPIASDYLAQHLLVSSVLNPIQTPSPEKLQ